MEKTYDVIVLGGGTAGTIAAIQAGREGAHTLLVEKNGVLGGTMTLGGINYPAAFFAWGQQIIGGIGWELVRKTLEETGRPVPGPEISRGTARAQHLPVDRTIFAALCDEAVLEAGVELLFHAMPASLVWNEGAWSVSICTKTGLQETRAKVLIDATGDANAVSLAGFKLVSSEVVQPATMTMYCDGYDYEQLDIESIKEAALAAIAAGELITTDISWHEGAGPAGFLRSRGGNANHIRAPHAESSQGRTAVEIEARRSIRRIYRFFRKQPGLENFRIGWTCPETGIRETVRIAGKHTITVEDYESGRVFPDALCYAFYPVDEHLNDGMGINQRHLEEHVLPTISRGSMLPAGSRFLIAAGRSLSSDREAHSALRVEAPCMAMGQAAGVMAALSARSGLDPEELPLPEIYEVLRRHEAVLPGDIAVG